MGQFAGVGSVFISSRMEELAIERRAAFAAVHRAGLVPLLFEVEPPTKDKKRIDDMVDRCDFFLGVYYLSFGPKAPELYSLRPVEYELVRFYTRHLLTNSPWPSDLSAADREEIDEAIDDEEWRVFCCDLLRMDQSKRRKVLGQMYRKGVKGVGQGKFSAASERVFLIKRRSATEDLLVSSELETFLRHQPAAYFESGSETIDAHPFLKEPRYRTATTDLFSKVYKRASEWRALRPTQEIKAPVPAASTESNAPVKIRCIAPESTSKETGVLYRLFDILFAKGLNIAGCWGGVFGHGAHEKVWVQIDAEAFHVQHESDSLVRELADQIWYLEQEQRFISAVGRDVKDAEVGVQVVPEGKPFPLLEVTERVDIFDLAERADMHCLKIEAVDIPGLNAAISHVLASAGWDVVLFASGEFAALGLKDHWTEAEREVHSRDILVVFGREKATKGKKAKGKSHTASRQGENDPAHFLTFTEAHYEISTIFGLDSAIPIEKGDLETFLTRARERGSGGVSAKPQSGEEGPASRPRGRRA